MKIFGKLLSIVMILIAGVIIISGVLTYSIFQILEYKEMSYITNNAVKGMYKHYYELQNLLDQNQTLNSYKESFDSSYNQFNEVLTQVFEINIPGNTELLKNLEGTANLWNSQAPVYLNALSTIQKMIETPGSRQLERFGHRNLMSQMGKSEKNEDKALFLILFNVERSFDEILTSSDIFNKKLLKLTDEIHHVAEKQIQWTLIRSIAMIVLLSIASFIIVYIFSHRLAARIQKMETVMSIAAQKNLAVQTHDKSRDEIGNLGRHLNTLIHDMNIFFQDVSHTADHIGDIGDNLAVHSAESASAIHEISNNLDSIEKDFKHLDNHISTSSQSINLINSRITNISSEIENQAASSDKAIHSVQNIHSEIQELSSITATRKEQSAELVTMVRTGEEMVEHTNHEINTISQELEGIMEIVEIINDIADKTNILSINAAIESAHAGEAGKGFSVVAEEIGRLATDTNENSRVITENLASITHRIQTSKETSRQSSETYHIIKNNIDHFIQLLTTVTDRIQNIYSSSNIILDQVGSMNTAFSTMTHRSSEIDNESQQIQRAMNTIGEISSHIVLAISEITSGAREISSSITEVSTMSQTSKEKIAYLNEKISDFQLVESRTAEDEIDDAESDAAPTDFDNGGTDESGSIASPDELTD